MPLEMQLLFQYIEKLELEMVNTLMKLIRIPAIGPESGGEGECKKAQVLMQILSEVGFDKIEGYDSVDPRVPSGKRPNIVAYLNGETDRPRLWIVTHLDVVPPGDETLWTVTKPFEPLLKDGAVYGRGSEDNGQSVVASIYAAKALKQLGIKPKRTLVLAFVADEEQGSTMGIQHLIKQDIFRSDDLILVPDSGNPQCDFIEVAEKSILWFKVTTIGKQTHASLPEKGLNAHRIGMQVALSLDSMLHNRYDLKNDYFSVPISTFEPTRKDRNVEAINIIPGEDVVFFDCRIIPDYNVDNMLSDIYHVTQEYEKKTGAKINVEVVQKQVSPHFTNANTAIIDLLKKTLKQAKNIEATVGGIGGGTCAAFFRKYGIQAAVLSTIDEVAHQHNEYSKVQNLVQDAKIFALLANI
jgi:succinyl-diaminopimelate desuccinylase